MSNDQQQSTINLETLNGYRSLAQNCTVDEARETMAQALYHLHVVLGSRNSFAEGPLSIDRGPVVEAMHRAANQFLGGFRI